MARLQQKGFTNARKAELMEQYKDEVPVGKHVTFPGARGEVVILGLAPKTTHNKGEAYVNVTQLRYSEHHPQRTISVKLSEVLKIA